MAAGQCPNCGAVTVPGAAFCHLCGTALPNTGAAVGGPLPFGSYPAPGGTAYPSYPGVTLVPIYSQERERTVTGLLLMVIGFALSWIPYVAFVGGLLLLIGIILVFLGRRAYGADHAHDAMVGAVLIFISVLASFILGVTLVVGIIGIVETPGASPASLASSLNGALETAFVGAVVVGVIGGIGQVVLIYALADRTARLLLWAGFVTSIVISVVIALVLLPEVSNAVTQATSGSTINPGPIDSLETLSTILGLTKVLPCLLFALGYYRARDEAVRRGQPSAPKPFP